MNVAYFARGCSNSIMQSKNKKLSMDAVDLQEHIDEEHQGSKSSLNGIPIDDIDCK